MALTAPQEAAVVITANSEEAEMLVMRFVDWYCGEVRRHLDRSERADRRSGRPRLAAAGD